jgi:hypothetical protein
VQQKGCTNVAPVENEGPALADCRTKIRPVASLALKLTRVLALAVGVLNPKLSTNAVAIGPVFVATPGITVESGQLPGAPVDEQV